MLITLDKTNPTPLYQQISEAIRALIISGQLKPAEPLPSIRQLAADHLVSVITTKRAYQDLENEGLIHTRPGIGTFVNEVTAESLKQLGSEAVEKKLVDAIQTSTQIGMSVTEIRMLFEKALRTQGLTGKEERR